MELKVLGGRLRDASDPIAVAVRACDASTDVAIHYLVDRRPIITIDRRASVTSAARAAYLEDGWRRDPLLRQLVEHHTSATTDVRAMHPIATPDGLLGVLETAPSSTNGAVVAMLVACRLAQLGAVPGLDAGHRRLTSRQLAVADLAAAGMSTREIAQVLAISANTVKARLKVIFEQLQINARVELVDALRRERATLVTTCSPPPESGISITWVSPDVGRRTWAA